MKKILSTILIILILTLGCLIYSRFISLYKLNIYEKTINNNSFIGNKILHISDIHYKRVIDEKQIKKLIKKINELKPDIVLFTGDLIDEDYEMTNKDTNFLIKNLSKIETKYGFYAILGDNDYKDIDTIKNIYIRSGITLLDNEMTKIYNESDEYIELIGLSSYNKNKFNINNINSNNAFVIVHEPDSIDEIIKNLNPGNIFAGHSINGSINIPIIKQLLLPKGAKKYYRKHYKIKNTNIYISNGIGVNNLNFRLFNNPSITLYRIKKNS